MYQAKITKTETGAPAAAAAAHFMSHMLGGSGRAEEVDAEQGIWLVSIDRFNAQRLEQDGYLAISISGYTIEIEMP